MKNDIDYLITENKELKKEVVELIDKNKKLESDNTIGNYIIFFIIGNISANFYSPRILGVYFEIETLSTLLLFCLIGFEFIRYSYKNAISKWEKNINVILAFLWGFVVASMFISYG